MNEQAKGIFGLDHRLKGTRGNLLLLLAGLTLINVLFYGIYAVKLLFPAVFFYHPLEGFSGLFCDFYNPVRYAYYLRPIDNVWSNAPPFLHFFCYLVSLVLRLFTPEKGGLAMAYTPAGQIGFALLALGMLVGISWGIARFAKPHLQCAERCWLCAMTVASYPFFFGLASGNMVLLVSTLIVLFLLCYEQKRYTWAAIWLGIAAALKLYPALLGVLFLYDKRWKEGLLCAAVGIGLTLVSLAAFQGGIIPNLLDFLEKTESYHLYGNLDLRRIMMNNNSLLMLWDIPIYMARGSLISLEEMAAHNAAMSAVLAGLLALSVASCFFLRRKQDMALLMCLWMVGYPYNSEPYNLTIIAVALVYWACREKTRRIPMMAMGVLLLMCKTRTAFYATNVRHITMQSVLNPALILGMILYLYALRHKEIFEDMKKAAAGIRKMFSRKDIPAGTENR